MIASNESALVIPELLLTSVRFRLTPVYFRLSTARIRYTGLARMGAHANSVSCPPVGQTLGSQSTSLGYILRV